MPVMELHEPKNNDVARSPTFQPFSRLPVELRTKILELAKPGIVRLEVNNIRTMPMPLIRASLILPDDLAALYEVFRQMQEDERALAKYTTIDLEVIQPEEYRNEAQLPLINNQDPDHRGRIDTTSQTLLAAYQDLKFSLAEWEIGLAPSGVKYLALECGSWDVEDLVHEFQSIHGFLQTAFPKLTELTIVISSTWQSSEHRWGNTVFVPIDNTFQTELVMNCDHGSVLSYAERQERHQRTCIQATLIRNNFESAIETSNDGEVKKFWPKVNINIATLGFLGRANYARRSDNLGRYWYADGVLLDNPQAIWIEILGCFCPCDTNGIVASPYDAICDLFEEVAIPLPDTGV